MTTKTRTGPEIERGGIEEAPQGFLFEMTGGALCLDFVNTVYRRPTAESMDHLETYDDLVAWGEQSCLFGKRQASALRREASDHTSRARSVLGEAKKLREAFFSIFSSIARGSKPPQEALAILNASLPQSLSGLRIATEGKGFSWCWESAGASLERVIHPVVESAADLLTSRELDRIRQCESEACDWIFLDRSRNRSRRWCDMTVCGNRAKARRHYHRVKKGV
jgi:predicted RNA-binding Zn ribbon-like protein